ncbi:hypothetical protein Tco_0679996 [Tanacetum coccineum]|uniref:Retrovirus-related Pol polyprotein from transposon TNT 1-94-like beta-barrel domain-containing protein n=1 Tax=Tanacetum coccineum TaxID=301880 RepID=A0ABQ4XJG3_9ASTR
MVDLEEKLSSHDRIVYKMGQSIQTIHMLGKKPNKVYDPFLKAGLGYKNPERLKKAIAAQPKMYDGKMLHSAKINIDSPDSKETLEDAEEKFSVEQTYFSIPSTSNNGSESKEVTSDLQISKMPKESKLLKIFDKMGVAINGLRTRIDKTLLEDRQRRWMSDINGKSSKENILQNEIDRLLEVSLTSEIQNCVLISVEKQKNELLKAELEKRSSDSKNIQANFLKRIKILEIDFKHSQAQSIDFEVKLQHQKEKIACDVSWQSKLSTINDENVLLKTQVDYVVKERGNIKLEYQKLFNSIKVTRTQHQKELDELIEHVDQKTYAYADVRVESSNSVRRQKSKDTKLKDRVLKNKTEKRPSAHVRKMSSSVSIDSNKRETMHSNVCQSNASVLSTKTVNVVNDGSNIVCVSHEKCVARYALSRNSSVKRALFTTPITAKSKNLGATSVVAKSRLSVAKTTRATNKVSSVLPLSSDSSQTKTAQSFSSETKSRIRVRSTSNTSITAHKLVAKLSTLPSAFFHVMRVIQLVLWIVDSGCLKHMTGNLQLLRNFVEKFMGTVRFGNDHFAAITGYMEIMFKEISRYVMYIPLKALVTIYFWLDNFVIEI